MSTTVTMYAYMFRPTSGGRWQRVSVHPTAEAAWYAAIVDRRSGDVRCDRIEVPVEPNLFSTPAEPEAVAV